MSDRIAAVDGYQAVSLKSSARCWAIAIVLVAQTAFFLIWLQRPLEVVADNTRYEVAGYNLSIGRGLSLPERLAPDDDVRNWVCSRHPEACLADSTYPVAIYPPGYSVFIAGSHWLFGRSLTALVIEQLVLLWLLFVLFEQVAARYLTYAGYLFSMGIAATYPFIARQASWIMSDQLHLVLYFAAFAALLLMKPGRPRGAIFGTLLGLTTLVRPYCLLVAPVVLLWPSVWRQVKRERWIAAVCFVLPIAIWTGRNAYWYGRFVPLTTNGIGMTLLHTTMEWEESQYDTDDQERWYGALERRFGADPLSHHGSRLAQEEAIRRIEEHPGRMLQRMLIHVPKSWVSLGTTGGGISRAWPLLVLYLGGLLALGIAGMWIKKTDEAWRALALGILFYWLMLIPIPADARRSLPLRLPMLLFAAVAAERIWEQWLAGRVLIRGRPQSIQ